MNLYGELKNRFIELKIKPEVYRIPYFCEYTKIFTDEELYLILKYPASKFKSYVKFIETLDKQGKLSGKKEVVRELTKIIYNSQSDNTGMLMNLILKTEIIFNDDILEFARSFINISSRYKADMICDLITNSDITTLNEKALMEIVVYINDAKTDEQVAALEDLFSIPNISKHEEFSRFVYLILNNPNSEFLSYIPAALENYNVYKSIDVYNLVSVFPKIRDSKVADLVLEIMTDYYMFTSNILKSTLNYVLDKKNKNKLSHIKFLVQNKPNINDMRFKEILALYNECDTKFKLDSITDLIANKRALTYNIKDDNICNQRGILNNYQFTLITNYILKSKTSFQAFEIVDLTTSIPLDNLENNKILDYLDSIIKTEYEFQAKLMTALIKSVVGNKYLYDKYLSENPLNLNLTFDGMTFYTRLPDALKAILKLEKPDLCGRLLDIFLLPSVLEYNNFDVIVNKYLKVKNTKQARVFYNIVAKPRFLVHDNLSALDYINFANDYQLQLIEKVVMNTDIYRDKEKCELLKCLLATNNRFVLNYITAILLKINIIGYKNADTIIKQVLENPNMLEYLIKTNLDKGFYGMDVIYAYEELNEDSIRVIDKVGKVLTKKKKN